MNTVPVAPPTSPHWFRALSWLAPLALIVTAWIPDDGADRLLPLAGSVTDTGLRVSRFSGTSEWPYRELRVRRTGGNLGLKMGEVCCTT